ncbi:MAG: glycosyltransferase family 4 protein [Dehalococcoidia bacterium]
MKITVSVSGKFSPGYLWAADLERRGMLERLITPLPYRRGAHFGVSRERTRSVWPIGAVNWTMQHVAPAAFQPTNQIAISAAYDEAASRLIGDCDVFNGWASMSLRSIREARRRGIPSVLQIASAHIVAQTQLLEEEARTWEFDAPQTHPGVIARTIREYEEADVLAVPAEFVRRTFIEQGVRASKIKLIPWGVQPVTDASGGSRLEAAASLLAARRERAEATERVPRILFVGGVGLRKGVPYLLAAFSKLETPATLRLVGAIDKRFLRALGGLPEGVEAVGVKTGDALASEFHDADVFVLPSVEDGFGIVTTEAMAAGLPAIVSQNCGSADAVQDGVNGFVVPARDSDALRDRLETLLADAKLRLRMGEAAASSVRGWSWEESGERHLREIYEPLLARDSKDGPIARAA